MEPFFFRIAQGLQQLEGIRGARLLLAVSGGPDSVLLLHFGKALQAQYACSLHVVHFNHGLRPESEEEAEFVAHLAQGLDFTLVKGFLPQGNLQQSARQWRRQELLRLLEQTQAQRILLGHQRSDLVETQLFRLARGTSLVGLSPMEEWEKPWWRPLLGVSRQEIQAYLDQRGLPYRMDSSNQEERYSRIRIRRQLLPLMNELGFGEVEPRLAALAEEARQLKALLWERLQPEQLTQEALPFALLQSLSPLLAKEALFLFATHHGLLETHQEQLQQVVELACSGRGDWQVQVKGGSFWGKKGQVRIQVR